MRLSFTAMSRASPLEWRSEADCTQRSMSSGAIPGSRNVSTRTGQSVPRAYGVRLPHGLAIRSMRPTSRGCPVARRSIRQVRKMTGAHRDRADLATELLQSADVDLRERRERLDRVPQHVERDVGADGQCRLLQPFPRLGSERVGAGQSLAVAEQGQE